MNTAFSDECRVVRPLNREVTICLSDIKKGDKYKECIKPMKEILQSLLVVICKYVICL